MGVERRLGARFLLAPEDPRATLGGGTQRPGAHVARRERHARLPADALAARGRSDGERVAVAHALEHAVLRP